MLDPRRMWYIIAAAAVMAAGIHWMRPSERHAADGPVAVVAAAEGSAKESTVTREQCLAQPSRLWVALQDGSVACIAYIASEGASKATTAVLFFEGDFLDEDMAPSRMDKIVSGYQRPLAEAEARFGLPFMVVARPGVMGSSGLHLIGGMREEGETMSAAIDALKERFGYQRIAVAGQSGGARIVAQLLVLGRRDITCAAMASGAYDVPRTRRGGHIRTNIFGDPGRRFLVPLQHTDGIVHSADRRTFVIGDPRDVRTPFDGQREWAETLQNLGHHALLLEGAAQDDEHHGLGATALKVAAMCAAGETDQDISAQVAADRLLRR